MALGPFMGIDMLRHGDLEGIPALIFPTLFAIGLFLAGRGWLRAAAWAEGEHFTMGVPWVLAIDGDRIDFPGNASRSPESWPLLETTVDVDTKRNLLRLAWGDRDLKYPAALLPEPPAAIRAQVLARQEEWRLNPGWPSMQGLPAIEAAGSAPEQLQDPRADSIGGGLRQDGEARLEQ